MKKYHTIIIGAGPAGLQCATILARHGNSVLLLERKETIGPKVCAGGIPFHAQAELNIPAHLLEGSFPNQHIKTPWQNTILRSNSPLISTVNRTAFGQWMLDEAIQAGVDVSSGTSVIKINHNSVLTKQREYGFKYLVGADGSSSLVRRYLNIKTKKLGAGINYQVPDSYEHMEWHLDPKTFKSGYAWIFPHRNSTSIGAYADRNDLHPSLLKKRLHSWAQSRNISLDNCKKPQAALINFDYQGWHFDNIFLAGDAAGLASGFTGEGIYPAIVSGETIAQSIINCSFIPVKLNRIIKQQARHNRMQKFFTGNKVICQISLEMLVLAIRLKLIGFEVMEMH